MRLRLVLPWAIAACGDDDDTEGLAASSRERAFLAAMVPHQESAVEIARTARSRAKHVDYVYLSSVTCSFSSGRRVVVGRLEELHSAGEGVVEHRESPLDV